MNRIARQEKLWCEVGKHWWSRPSARGVKPKVCAEHKTKPESQVAEEILTCQAGHTWTRPSARGKKPVWCPQHKPVKVKASRAVIERNQYDLDALRERVGYVSGPVAEAFRVIEYINRRLATCDADDVSYLVETRRIWLNRIKRDTKVNIDVSE